MALLERLARTARSWRRIASLKTLTPSRAPSRDVPPHYYLLQGLLGAGAGWHVTGVLLGTTYDDDEESQKLALSESTGLDRKQINIWFINQRKRHWKPSEDMQFVVIDATYPHYYMDNVLSNPFPTERSPHISLKTEPWIHRRRPDKLEGQLHLICKLS